MKNEFLDYEVGTVLKEIYMDGDESYYIVGSHFIYMNDFDYPEIRPWKFDASCCYVATGEEKEAFLKDLEKNNLIWNEETGKVERKFRGREEEINYAIPQSANDNEALWFVRGAKWSDKNPRQLWKDAQGDDLPEIDREVIALIPAYDGWKVVFAHRPDPAGCWGKSILSDEYEHFQPETYDGWNIPNIKWWLDLKLPEGGEK